MITYLSHNKGTIDKISKSILGYTKTALLANKGFTLDTFNGQEIDMFNIACYITSAFATPEAARDIAKCKELTAKEVYELAQKNKGSQDNTQMNSDEKLLVAQVNLGSNPNYAPLTCIFEAFKQNENITAIVITEAILISCRNVIITAREPVLSTFNINCLIFYYWASKRYKLAQLKTVLKQTCKKPLVNDKTFDSIDSMVDLIKYIYKDKKSSDTAIKYVELMCGKQTYEFENYYALMDDFATCILQQAKKNEYLDSLIETTIKFIYSNRHLSGHFVSMLDKRSIRKYSAIIVSTSMKMVDSSIQLSINPLKLYIYKKVREENYEFGGNSCEYIIDMIFNDACCLNNNLEAYKSEVVGEYFEILYKEFNMQKASISGLQEKVDTTESKLQESKKQLRQFKKENEKIEREARELLKRCNKLEEITKDSISREDMDKLKAKISEYERKIKDMAETSSQTDRALSKKAKELDYLSSKIDKMETEYLELLEKYDREKEISIKMSVQRKFSNIPIECFVNAISNTRIALIGGDMMFNKLKEYGLTNIKTYKAGCRNITYEDISDIELLVAATAFVDHASLESAINAARNHKIPLLMFNNKNADMLIYDIFEELHK